MQHFSKIFKMCNIFLGIFSKNCRFFRKKAGFSGHETAKKVIVSITYRASCRKNEEADVVEAVARERREVLENDEVAGLRELRDGEDGGPPRVRVLAQCADGNDAV